MRDSKVTTPATRKHDRIVRRQKRKGLTGPDARTRQDRRLEVDEKKRDVYNPFKAKRAKAKAAKKATKAGMSLQDDGRLAGIPTGSARSVKRAQKAAGKYTKQNAKRGYDAPPKKAKRPKEGHGVLTVKRSSRDGGRRTRRTR